MGFCSWGPDDESVERSLDGCKKECRPVRSENPAGLEQQEGCQLTGGLVGVSFSCDASELNLFFPFTWFSGARWQEKAERILLKEIVEG